MLVSPVLRTRISSLLTLHFRRSVAIGALALLTLTAARQAPPPDTTAPTITQVQAGTATDTTAELTWLTDEAADSQVTIVGPLPCPATGCVTSSAIFTTAHSVVLSGLKVRTTYQLVVQSTDAAGNPASVAASVTTAAAGVPPGFAVAAFLAPGSFSRPTAMQFAPDGRLFVCEQIGRLRVVKAGVLEPTPFVTLAADSAGERGLLGVAFDPDFSTNQFLYVYYTVPASGGTPAHGRVSRFTANGDVAVPGSEFVVMDLDSQTGSEHIGGTIDFGPDGKLYVAVGDNGVASNAQSMSTRHGKMLRIDPDGTIPADNPFYLTASGPNRAIWALGLRNPFTFAHNPTGPSPRMLINDVGQENWEEVNEGIAGANYGWPATEGPTTDPAYQTPRYAYGHHLILRDGVWAADGSGVEILWAGGSIYVLGAQGGSWWKWLGGGWTNVGPTRPAATVPPPPPSGTASPDGTAVPPAAQIVDAEGAVWTLSGVGTPTGCAITGGAFYNPTSATFPDAYRNSYFFADFCAGWIKRVDPTLASPSAIDFATGISLPVDLKVGSDGGLYYLSRGQGTVFRVQYSNDVPVMSTHPADVTVAAGQPATFSATATGAAPLSYQWQRSGADIDGATSTSYVLPATTLVDSGAQFRLRVSNTFGTVFSNVAALTVVGQPTITQLQVGTVTETAAVLTWRTDVAADSRVEILGPLPCPAAGCVAGSAARTTTHSVSLSGLTAGTAYQLSVQSTDAAGQTASAAASVTTLVNLPSNESPDGTLVPPAGQIVDALGAVWTMNGAAILRNGVSAGGGSGVTMLWTGGSIYVLGAPGGSWWKWLGASWTNVGLTQPGGTVAPPPPPAGGPPSADGTEVPPAAQIVDALGAVWTMNGAAVLRNGVSAGGGSGVKTLWTGGSIYVLGAPGGSWWKWLGSTWANVGTTQPGGTVTPPPPPPTGGTPSADGTEVPPAAQIVDALGAVWTMNGAAILRDGVSAGGGSGVKTLWTGGSIYVLGATGGSWWKWLGSTWTNVGLTQPGGTVTPPPPPPTGGTPSADGTEVPPAGQIVDALGAVWTISGGTILRNGVSAAGGTGVAILWSSGSIYVQSSFGGSWWKWLGSGWTNVGTTRPGTIVLPPPPPPTGGTPSADGTAVPPAAQIVDAAGAVWTLSGQVILRNGVHAAAGTGFRIVWLQGTIYVLGSDNTRWWRWTGSSWAFFGTTPPPAG